MSLSRLLPKSAEKKSEEKYNNILYTVMVEWGWSWQQFQQTPLPVLLRLLKTHNKVQKEKQKAAKRKK